jgi:DNA-binding Xre family transcriptional regulator
MTMKIKLRNRLEVLMRDSGVKSIEEMAQRLTENQGYKITRTPLSRKFKDDDVQLPLSLIEALCNELQCLPGDLFETNVSDAPAEFVDDLRSRLQPFRYGTLRLAKPGSASDAQAPAQEAAAPPAAASPEPTTARPKPRLAEQNLDDLAGPKVTHLNAKKVKSKS